VIGDEAFEWLRSLLLRAAAAAAAVAGVAAACVLRPLAESRNYWISVQK